MVVDIDRDDLSFWAPPDAPPRPPLTGNSRCDVAIVGAGMTGLSAAYHLVRERPDLDVVLLEAQTVASGASGRNTGILRPGVGGTVLDLQRRFGADLARQLYAASLDAVDAVVELIDREHLDCDVELVSHVKLALTEHHAERLVREADSLRSLGFPAQVLGDDAAIAPVPAVAALDYVAGGQLNPVLMCRELARVVEARGVRLHERTAVCALAPGRPARLVLEAGSLTARRVVLATNGYTPGLGVLRGRVVPLQTHVCVTEPLSRNQLASLGWTGGKSFSDKRHIFDYHRLTSDRRIMFGGGRPLYRPWRTDIADPRVWAAQQQAFRSRFPELGGVRIAHKWSGTMGMTSDRFPVVGTVAPGVVLAGAWNGHGVALATASGALVADVVHGRETPRTHLPWTRTTAPYLGPDPLLAAALAAYVAGLRATDRLARRTPSRSRTAPDLEVGASCLP